MSPRPAAMRQRATHAAMLAMVVGVLVTACTSGGAAPTDESDPPSGRLLVFAAASLGEAFNDIGAAFEGEYPDVDVLLNVGGSSALREQVLQGAPADVLATADGSTMADVADLVVDDPTDIATNRLAIVVPSNNPAGVLGLEDFRDDDLLIGLCAVEVPCGALAGQVFDAAGIDPRPDTREPDVRALVTKVAAGELDAGIAYVTDVDDTMEAIAIPPAFAVTSRAPIAVLADAPNPRAAVAFVAFVQGTRGRSLLADAGFGAP